MVYESEIPNRLKCASSKRKSFVIVSAHDVPADPRVPPSRTRARRTTRASCARAGREQPPLSPQSPPQIRPKPGLCSIWWLHNLNNDYDANDTRSHKNGANEKSRHTKLQIILICNFIVDLSSGATSKALEPRRSINTDKHLVKRLIQHSNCKLTYGTLNTFREIVLS